MQQMSKRKPKPADAKSPRRSGENLNVWVRSELFAALLGWLETTKPRVSKTAAVEEAIEAFLAERGHWPPSLPEAKSDD